MIIPHFPIHYNQINMHIISECKCCGGFFQYQEQHHHWTTLAIGVGGNILYYFLLKMDSLANLYTSYSFMNKFQLFLLSDSLAFCQFISIYQWNYGPHGQEAVCVRVCMCV